MLPGGRFNFIVPPMCRGYIVSDGQPLFGVPRDGYSVTYVFDGANRLRGISFDLPPERREQMVGALYALASQPIRVQSRVATRTTSWAVDGGVSFWIRETIGSKYPLIWVNFEAPPTGLPSPSC